MRTKGVGFCLAVTACWVSGLVLDSPCFGRHDPRFPDHPVTATVRTADMPFKRLPPEMSPPPAVNLPTADLSWDSQTFQSPWSILDKADPSLQSLFREQLNQLRENGQPAADFEHALSTALAASPLTAEQLRSLGWAVSFVANSHHGGLAWYRQCVAKIRENSHLSSTALNSSDGKLLHDLRNKFYDAEDWDGLRSLCEVAFLHTLKNTNDDFWWTIFYALSFANRSTEKDEGHALNILEELDQRLSGVHLGHYERETLDVRLGYLLYRAGRYTEAIPHLRSAEDDHHFDHCRLAGQLLISALAKSGSSDEAERARKDYCSRFQPDFEESIKLLSSVADEQVR